MKYTCAKCGGPIKLLQQYQQIGHDLYHVLCVPVCTCTYSPVNTKTEDPPYIVYPNPNCPRHGDLA